MVDRVQPLKLEDTGTGGGDVDAFPTALSRNQDYVDCRGVALQDAISNDATTLIERNSGDMLFRDGNNPSPTTLTQLKSPAVPNHKALRDLIHFVDDGPADGWASGAYREITGNPFPTAEIWWESAAKLKKIVSLQIVRSGTLPTTETWKIYDTDGVTALVTVTDTITYSGAFEVSRTRTWA